MHVVRLWLSDVRAVLKPSVGYSSPSPVHENLDPLLCSDFANVTYSWDSPGQSAYIIKQALLRCCGYRAGSTGRNP